MSLIQIENLSFTWPGALHPVFENVNLELDTAWRLGLVGRNGRGKTTFLRLLMGHCVYTGRIAASEQFEYFPTVPEDPAAPALAVARGAIAPFDAWEARMHTLAAAGTEEAMQQYGEIEHAYAAADGYVINESIAAECGRLGIAAQVLEQPYNTLSGGEKVKLLLAAQFLKKHSFLLIDEPTDHLDAEGRRTVAKWLAGKSGFILVSHDRAFLDEAVDHILSINKADIELQKGNYTTWRQNRDRQDAYELAENARLQADIRHLQQAAKRTERWSDQIEKSKKGGGASYNGGPASVDKGYIGHQSARMMQRSKAIEKRRGRQMDEKKQLLKNLEETEALRFHVLVPEKRRLVTAEGIGLRYGQRTLFEGLDFVIEQGDRVSIQGPNGSGKTSLLRMVLGLQEPCCGQVRRLSSLGTSTLPQETAALAGSLQAFAAAHGLDVSLFLALLRKLDFAREAFDRDMQTYSAGQRKKVYLAASLAKPAHLFVWDEPLNYIDVLSREQVEQAVLHSAPTILFVEHDAVFAQKVATKTIDL